MLLSKYLELGATLFLNRVGTGCDQGRRGSDFDKIKDLAFESISMSIFNLDADYAIVNDDQQQLW